MTAAFFSDSVELFQQHLSSKHRQSETQTKVEDLQKFFDLERCVKWIEKHKFTRVALQFPDDLLGSASTIASFLDLKTEAKIFILADTSFGSCCVDEVAAEHHKADSLIHFGHACLSPTQRLPVFYVFGHAMVDIEKCYQNVSELIPDVTTPLLLLADVEYQHVMGGIGKKFGETYSLIAQSRFNIQSSHMDGNPEESSDYSKDSKETKHVSMMGKTLELHKHLNIEDYTVLYIGGEENTLTNWMMNLNKCIFYSYDPVTNNGVRVGLSVSKLLMKRYYMIERAKDANIVGILIGTLGVTNYLDIISHLKKLLKKAGKKSYIFAVGKLNVAKLANFQDVDVFVLVACPENTIIDSSEFYQPVVTPYEMEIACNQARQWTGDYVTDFSELLPGAASFVPVGDKIEAQTDVSLVTGRLRQIGTDQEDDPTVPGSELVPKGNSAITCASERLAERTWSGLEEKLGQTPVVKAVQGSTGIAMGYNHEPQDNH